MFPLRVVCTLQCRVYSKVRCRHSVGSKMRGTILSAFILLLALVVCTQACSILVSNAHIPHDERFDEINHYLVRRGPDLTSRHVKDKFTFIHNLLSMTGAGFTKQPFVSEDGNVVAMFNGEIYNYRDFGDFPSDGYCILPLYKKYRDGFVTHLDGEFAIVVFDFKRNIVVYSTDVFAIKPLWVAVGDNLGLSSYASPLKRLGLKNIEEVPANSIVTRSLTAPYPILRTRPVHEFDLRQYKTDISDWKASFLRAVHKRIRDLKYNVFVSLSSGHDSGAISLALKEIGKKHTTMTIIGDEYVDILEKRKEYLKDVVPEPIFLKFSVGGHELNQEKEHLQKYVEPYECPIYMAEPEFCFRDVIPALEQPYRTKEKTYRVLTDSASLGHSAIGRRAKENRTLVLLSAGGGDEILNDYGFAGSALTHSQSCLKGYFPDNLSTVFPWTNFFKGTQRAYLRKEEHVSGSHGLEVGCR
mgnify:CR=1 FL=1